MFESVSGFTTTGASVLTNVEASSKGVLFWRALTHWLGGMGFIVLSVAILPFVGVGGMQLFKAEVPSPTPDRLAPRITDTASVLWKVYAAITAAEVILLMLGGMDWFDATCQSFATMATGGFSTKNASIAGFNSDYVDVVVTIFMILAGMNFTLHFQMMWQRRWSAWWRNEEWRTYMYLWLGAALVGCHGPVVHLRQGGLGVHPPGRFPKRHHPYHHRIRHGGLRPVAPGGPGRPGDIDVHWWLGRLHRRRPQGNAPDGGVQAGQGRAQAPGASSGGGPGAPGASHRGPEHRGLGVGLHGGLSGLLFPGWASCSRPWTWTWSPPSPPPSPAWATSARVWARWARRATTPICPWRPNGCCRWP